MVCIPVNLMGTKPTPEAQKVDPPETITCCNRLINIPGACTNNNDNYILHQQSYGCDIIWLNGTGVYLTIYYQLMEHGWDEVIVIVGEQCNGFRCSG